MKILLAFVALLVGMGSAFGANPSYQAFRGTGGITIVSNPPDGTVVISGAGISGAVPGGNNYSVQYNGTNLFSGDNNYQYIPAHLDGGDPVAATVYLVDGVQTNTLTGIGIGTLSLTPFYLGTGGSYWWQVSTGGHFTPVVNGSTARMGIGLTAPTVPLEVVGDVKVGGSLYISNTAPLLRMTSYGNVPLVNLIRYAGTYSAPTAVQGGDLLGWITLSGYGDSAAYDGVRLESYAKATWNDTGSPGLFRVTIGKAASTLVKHNVMSLTENFITNNAMVYFPSNVVHQIGAGTAGQSLVSADTAGTLMWTNGFIQNNFWRVVGGDLVPVTDEVGNIGSASFRPFQIDSSVGYLVNSQYALSRSGTILQHGNSSVWTAQQFLLGGVERMRIAAGGYVGIGVTTPSHLLTFGNITGATNLTMAVVNTNGVVTSGINSNGLAWLFPDGSAAVPSMGWLSDADGAGTGLFRGTTDTVGVSVNGSERFRVNASGVVIGGISAGAFYGAGSSTAGGIDSGWMRIGPGVTMWDNGNAATTVTNRYSRVRTGTTSTSPTNAAWLETGFDMVHGWAFMRSMADGVNQTTQPIVLGVNTNEMLRIHTNGTVVMKVPLVYPTGAGTAGHVLTSTDTAGTVGWAAAGGGGGASLAMLSNGWLRLQLQSAILPTNAMPALDTGTNYVWRLLFDDTTAETAYWDFVLPDDYGTNATVVCTYSTLVAAASKTNCFVFQTQVLPPLTSNNINVDSWAASGGVTNVIPTANGWATNFSGNLSLSAVAGDFVRLKINRDAASAMDSATGDTALHSIAIRYTKR